MPRDVYGSNNICFSLYPIAIGYKEHRAEAEAEVEKSTTRVEKTRVMLMRARFLHVWAQLAP
jgi:hypothetical protein